MSEFKPMLASPAPENLSALRFPLLASPKLDGIRCVIRGGKALSRKLKPIPNDFVRQFLELHAPEGADGELLLADPTAPFADVSSAIMSKEGMPQFTYAVFDSHILNMVYDSRLRIIADEVAKHAQAMPEEWRDRIQVVHHVRCENLDELLKVHQIHITQNFEGTMIRAIDGPYKFGRSTAREGFLLKLKDFTDEEAVVIGAKPFMRNENEQERDALGHAKRSKKAEGLVAVEKLGALLCRTDDGAEFDLGGGFSEEQRVNLWKCHMDGVLHGLRCKFKHQPPPGGRRAGVAPRFPVFLGWRDSEID